MEKRKVIEMTIDEAIKHCWDITAIACKRCADEHAQLAAWLEELKEYQSIGTPEQCREAMNKQMRLPVNNQEGDSYYFLTGDCPVCGFRMIARGNYCINCGQRLSYKDASTAEIINNIIRGKNNHPLATLAMETGNDHIVEVSKKEGEDE